MQETNSREKERLSGKCHIRLREQIETDARYPIRNAIARYSELASITNIPVRRTNSNQMIFDGYYRKLMDYTGLAETRSWAAM
jgi:hypothetical protein